jgi:5-formyltetrahydrofolate cyclo-ligase
MREQAFLLYGILIWYSEKMKQDKAVQRKHFLTLRQSQTIESLNHVSRVVCSLLAEEWERNSFDMVLGYRAFRGEVDVTPFLANIAPVGLPVIGSNEGAMDFYKWSQGDAMQVNRFGIEEPLPLEENRMVPSSRTLILVPALAIDRLGFRLGYGGGYYDRYLKKHEGKGLGCVPAQFFVGELPRGEFDVQLAACVTENSITVF